MIIGERCKIFQEVTIGSKCSNANFITCRSSSNNKVVRRKIKAKVLEHFETLIKRYPVLEIVNSEIVAAYRILEASYKNGGKLLVAGNGGSVADAEHIVGELMKGFKLPRKPQANFAEKLLQENAELGAILATNL